jgi:predicted transcriptional regulator
MLTFDMDEKLLAFLISRGLVKESDEKKNIKYKVTKKGLVTLQLLKNINRNPR